MIPKEVTIKYARKFNMGNYQSMDIEISYTASLEEGETPDQVAEQLIEHAHYMVGKEHQEIIKNTGVQK
jgi:hypothetical protein